MLFPSLRLPNPATGTCKPNLYVIFKGQKRGKQLTTSMHSSRMPVGCILPASVAVMRGRVYSLPSTHPCPHPSAQVHVGIHTPYLAQIHHCPGACWYTLCPDACWDTHPLPCRTPLHCPDACSATHPPLHNIPSPPRCMLEFTYCEQTNMSKNITFPQLHLK